MKTILITGANGFIAKNFMNKYANTYKFILLSHKAQKNHITLEELAINLALIRTVDVVINFAGANIGSKRWGISRKIELLASRVNFTENLVRLLNQHNTNCHFISASAVGIYDFNSKSDEDTPINYDVYSNFSQELTKKWEQKALNYNGLLTITRFGVVLSSKGGAFGKILLPFKLFVGGKIGDGLQQFSWIALDDLISALDFIINKKIHGVINITAPEEINNKKLTASISSVWHRPSFITVPQYLVKILWGQMGDELLLNGVYAIPKRLISLNFNFKYPDILSCLTAIKQNNL